MTPAEKEKERNRLYQLYWERDKEFEAAKGRRTILTILGFSVVNFAIFYTASKPTGLDIVYCFIVSLILAGFHFFVNSSVFAYLAAKGREENERLKAIRKQIDDLD